MEEEKANVLGKRVIPFREVWFRETPQLCRYAAMWVLLVALFVRGTVARVNKSHVSSQWL